MIPDNERSRPVGGPNGFQKNTNSHPQGYDMTSSQPTGVMATLLGWDRYPTSEDAAPAGEFRYPAPAGYVAVFSDGDVWDVTGFDRRGNALIMLPSGDLVRANAYPTFAAEGFEGVAA